MNDLRRLITKAGPSIGGATMSSPSDVTRCCASSAVCALMSPQTGVTR